MRWFLNRFFGTFLGFGFGLVKAPYMMGIGVYHAVGSIALFLRAFAYQTLSSAKKILKESARNFSRIYQGIKRILFTDLPKCYPNPIDMFIDIIAALVVLPIAFVVMELALLVAQASRLLNTLAFFMYNVVKSLVTMALIALSLPFVGLVTGFMHGIGEAYRQIFVGQKRLNDDDNFNNNNNRNINRDDFDFNEEDPLVDHFDAAAEAAQIDNVYLDPVIAANDRAEREAVIRAAEERRRRLGPVDHSVNGYIHRVFVNSLPLNKAAEGTDKNRDLAVAIDILPKATNHLTVKEDMAKLDATNPVKIKYEELNEKYSCVLSLDNLFDIEQPIVVEYKMNGETHAKVFANDDFISMLNAKNDDFASLPESRTPLTSRYRGWEQVELDQRTILQSVDHQVERGRLVMIPGSEMKIYKGLPIVVEQELAKAKNLAKKGEDLSSETNEDRQEFRRVPGGI